MIAFSGFLLIAFLYASPVLQGKRLVQHDSMQAKAAAQEIVEYRNKTGKQSLWTNSMFGGMPGYMIASNYPNSFTTHLGRVFTGLFPEPVNLIWLCMAGFYVLMMALGVEAWLGALGAIGFAFCAATFTSIEAGHVSKVIAIAYAPPLIAGFILCFRGKYLLGAALTALFLGLQLYGNHVQITYYTFIALGIYGLFELIWAVRENRLKQFILAGVVVGAASAVAVGTHASRLWTAYEYSKATMRGKSELTIAADTTQKAATQPVNGLDREYAFRWSYGIGETFNLLIPNFYGGASNGSLSASSNTFKTLTEIGASKAEAKQFVSQVPLYWGDQPITGGPAYAGAVVIFLFVLGMFLVKDPIKWWALAVTVLFIMLAWGKNFPAFNNLVFDYLPMYNKFRAVTMLLNLAQIFMVIVGVLGLQELIKGNWKLEEVKKSLLQSVGIVGGFCLLFALAGGLFFNFSGPSDQAFSGQIGDKEVANRIISSIQADRASLLSTDAFRSLVLILLATALIWFFTQKKIKSQLMFAGLIVLVLIDLFMVDKRYLNNDDFKTASESSQVFAPSAADQQILQDKDLDFRVLYTPNPWGDATASFFHKSIGGYHGAKMGRYNELIEFQIAKSNMAVLNMLNTKYFIVSGQDGQLAAQRNPAAMGSVWFVNSFQIVPDANAEIKALDSFDPKQVAFIDKRFEDQLKGLQIQSDSAASIRLTKYAPDNLSYESNANTEQLAVFSEIYYNGNTDWKAFVDGKPAPHLRANYVLRAMRIPAGKHTIEFRFEPPSYYTGEMIALVSSILMVLLLAAAVLGEVKRKGQEKVAA